MEVHRQQCQTCGHHEVKNILVREPDLPTIIYVHCTRCKAPVARYELSDYYHHGKDIESFLGSQGAACEESGRKTLGEFEETRTKALEGYLKSLEVLDRQEKSI